MLVQEEPRVAPAPVAAAPSPAAVLEPPPAPAPAPTSPPPPPVVKRQSSNRRLPRVPWRRRHRPGQSHRRPPAASSRRPCGCGWRIRGRSGAAGAVRRPLLVRPPVQTPQPPQAPTGNLSRPPGTRPGGPPLPAGARAPIRPGTGLPPRPPMGGPRPLPSQPVRPPAPPPRPGMPGYRPPIYHRPGSQRPGSTGRRDQPRMPASVAAPVAPPPVTRTITLAEGMTVKDLATSSTSGQGRPEEADGPAA